MSNKQNNSRRSSQANSSQNNSSLRKVKGGDIKLNLTLNEEQKSAKAIILENKLTILRGSAGSGKTQTAVAVALDLYFKGKINKIVLTRPLVTSGEDTGFLPGDLKAKLDPYLQPLLQNMYNCVDKMTIDAMIEGGDIEICPIAFIRGRTFVKSFVIVDEVQNCTHKQTEDILTRIGLNTKMVLCGDLVQCDLRVKKDSGLPFLRNLDKVEGIAFVDLIVNHRDPIVESILKVYGEYRD